MQPESIDFTIITSEADAPALAGEWRALQKRVGKSIFTDYDWFHTWWQTLGNHGGRQLHIVTGHRDGKLVALLPLAVTRWKGFRILQAIGAEAFYCCDMLCENEADARALWQAARRCTYYDFAHIRDVCPDSLCEQALGEFADLHDRDNAYFLTFDWPTGEAWQAQLPSELRRVMKRRQRRLEEKGAIDYELIQSEPIPDGIIEGLVAHKKAWCEQHGLQGMFDQPHILSFYRLMTRAAAQGGTLLLAQLRCGETVIAWHLMFRYGERIYSYAMAVDPAWLAYSPGNLAHMKAISWAIDNGYAIFDHMQGDFAYKRQFSNDARQCKEYFFTRSLKGKIGASLFIGRRALRRWREARKRPH